MSTFCVEMAQLNGWTKHLISAGSGSNAIFIDSLSVLSDSKDGVKKNNELSNSLEYDRNRTSHET